MTQEQSARQEVTSQDVAAQEFEAHRRRLVGLAYRMLGTLSDADDVVQDAWLRMARIDRSTVRDLGPWLTTVTSRLCLDRLRESRASRAAYVGPWLPEPVVASVADPAPGPEALAVLDDSVRLALLVVLESLAPEQRVAFVLHDVFAVPFDEVAGVLGSTPAAARQLASRGRRAVHEAGPPAVVPMAQQAAVVQAFAQAAAEGDLAALVRTLAPDVVLRSDGGGRVRAALRPVAGADKVARLLLGLPRLETEDLRYEVAVVNGELGFVIRTVTTDRVTVVVPHVGGDGLVHGVDIVRNPEKLRHLAAAQDAVGGPPDGPEDRWPTGGPVPSALRERADDRIGEALGRDPEAVVEP